MSTFQKVAVFSTGTPSVPNLTLSRPLSSTDTSASLSVALPISDAELAKTYGVAISVTSGGQNNTKAGYTEVIFALTANVSADKKTLSSLTRGVQADATGISSDSTLIGDHPAGSRVDCVVLVQTMNQLYEVLGGLRGTGAQSFIIGDGTTDAKQLYKIDTGAANPVGFGVDTSGNPIVQLENGTTFIPGASAAALTGGDGIDITSSVVSTDLDTNPGLEINSAKLRVKVKASGGITRDSDGLSIDQSNVKIGEDVAVTATSTEINQALDGINGTVDAAALNVITGGASSDADGEHTHATLAKSLGAVTSTVTVSNTVTETTIGTVTVPANALGTAGYIKGMFNVSDLDGGGGVNDDLHIRLKYGATTIADCSRNQIVMTDGVGIIEFGLFANGATNSQTGFISGRIFEDDTGTPNIFNNSAHGTAAEDSTGALSLTVTVQWDNASASDSISVSHGSFELYPQ